MCVEHGGVDEAVAATNVAYHFTIIPQEQFHDSTSNKSMTERRG